MAILLQKFEASEYEVKTLKY